MHVSMDYFILFLSILMYQKNCRMYELRQCQARSSALALDPMMAGPDC